MKYKVGDKVKVISNLARGTRYPYKNRAGDSKEMDTNQDMVDLAGKTVTISYVNESRGVYNVKECPDTSWVESMFEDAKAKEDIKRGTKLKVLDDLDYDGDYEYTDKNTGRKEKFGIYRSMKKLEGLVVTVRCVDSDGTFKIFEDEGDNWWCLSMFNLDVDIESQPDLKIGDRVKVIDGLEDKRYYYIDKQDGDKESLSTYSNMRKLSGTFVTVAEVDDDGTFKIKEDGKDNWWCLSMIDLSCKEEDKKEEPSSNFRFDSSGILHGRVVAKMNIGDKVKLIPFIKYTGAIVEWKHSQDEDLVRRECYPRLVNLINKPLIFKKLYGDGDAEIRYEEGYTERYTYAPECCLMPWDMKVSQLPRPNDTDMARLYDAYIAKYEPESKETDEEKDLSQDADYVNFVTQRQHYTKSNIITLLNKADDASYKRKTKKELLIELYKKSKEVPEIEDLENKNLNDESEDINMSKLGLGGMLTKMFGEVGEVKDASLALTLTGEVAAKRKDGDFVRYDAEKEVFENQGSLIFPGSEKFMLLMPSPTVAEGDVIKHKGKYLQVLEVRANGSLSTVNYETGTKTTVVKETNLFNMQFYTKVVSMMTGFNGTAGSGNTGFNPLMMLLLDKEEGKEMDMASVMMLSGMFGGNQANGQMNPMLMMMMLGDKEGGESTGMKDMMMMSMFMGGSSPFGNLFGQAPAQIASEPIKPLVSDDDKDAIIAAQAKLIKDLQAKGADSTDKKETSDK